MMLYRHFRTGKIREIEVRQPTDQDEGLYTPFVGHGGDQQFRVDPDGLRFYRLISVSDQEIEELRRSGYSCFVCQDDDDEDADFAPDPDYDPATGLNAEQELRVIHSLYGTRDSIEQALLNSGLYPEDYDIEEVKKVVASVPAEICPDCGYWYSASMELCPQCLPVVQGVCQPLKSQRATRTEDTTQG